MLKPTLLSLSLVALSSALLLNGCTNPTTHAGAVSEFMDGTILGVEIVDMDSDNYDTGTNTLLGALAGAAAGQAINHHSKGTLIGAGIGAVAAGLASGFGNRSDGVRLTIDTSSGQMVVDEPFSCLYRKNAKVRLISNSQGGQVQVLSNGRYITAKQESKSNCPVHYQNIQNGTEAADALGSISSESF
ncbi:MAG: hypothetical protein K6F05_06805 [Succinivibrio sp.]|nr:hypothetical protein [Succinivibrio sp.]